MVEPSEGTQIRVDLDGLHDFARKLRQETDATMRRCLDKVTLTLATGTPFGVHSASGNVFAAKARYRTSAVRAVETMRQYVLMAEALADAAETIANRYAGSDAFAAARAGEVQQEYAAALVAAQARQRVGGQPGAVL